MAAPSFELVSTYESNGEIGSDSFSGPDVTAVSNRIAVLKFGGRSGNGAGWNFSSAPTYDGVSSTLAVTLLDSGERVSFYLVPNPPTGIKTIAWTVNNLSRVQCGIEIYSGADTGSPVGDTQSAGGNANTSTLNYTTEELDSLLLDCFNQRGLPVLTHVSPQTERFEIEATGGGPAASKPTHAGSSRLTGAAGAYSTQYDSDTTQDFVYAGIELKPFVAAAGVPIDAILDGIPADLLLNGVPVNEINT